MQNADLGDYIRVVATTSDPDNTLAATATSAVTGAVGLDHWIAGSGNWTTAADWSLAAPPTSAQMADLDAAGIYTVTSSGTVTVAELISNPTATLNITGGTFTVTNFEGQGPLVLSGGTLNIGSSTDTVTSFTLSGGTLTESGTLTVSGATNFSGTATVTGSGTGTIIADGGAAFSNNFIVVTLSGETLDLYGTNTWSGSAPKINLNSGSSLVIESGATFTDTTGGQPSLIQSTAGTAGTVTNEGTYVLDNNLTSAIAVAFNNDGIVNVEAGTLNLAAGGTDVGATYEGAGTIEFSASHTLNSTSSITSHALFSGGTTTVNGSYDALGTAVSAGTANLDGTVTSLGAVDISAGTLNLNGTSTNATSFTLSGGTLTESGTLTVSGATNFSGTATVTGSGTGTIVADGGAAFSNSFIVVTLSGETLDLYGTNTWSGSAPEINLNSGSSLVIESGATFTDTTGGQPSLIQSTAGTAGTVTNEGTYVLDNNLTSAIAVAFNNTGIVNVEAGVLKLTGGLTNNGELEVSGGKIDVTTAVTGSGGTVSVTGGGTAEFDGAFNQNASFTGSGALLLSAADSGTIGGFGSGDVLDLINIAYAAGDYAVWSQGAGTLQLFASGGGSPLETLNLSGTYTTANFTVVGDGGGGTSGHAEVTFATQPPVLGGATSTTVTQDSLATLGATDTASSSVDALGNVTITGLPGDLTQGDFNGGSYTPGTNGATGSWIGSAQAFNALAFTVSEAGEFTLDISTATVGAATPATEDYTLIVSSAQSGADNWIATTGDWNTDGDWSSSARCPARTPRPPSVAPVIRRLAMRP